MATLITVSKSGSPVGDFSTIQAGLNAVTVPRDDDFIVRIIDEDLYDERVVIPTDKNTSGFTLTITRDVANKKLPAWGSGTNFGLMINGGAPGVDDVIVEDLSFTRSNTQSRLSTFGDNWVWNRIQTFLNATNVAAWTFGGTSANVIIKNCGIPFVGASVGAVEFANITGALLLHNQFLDPFGTASGAIYIVRASASNVKVYNNVFTVGGNVNAIAFHVQAGGETGFDSDGNILLRPNTGFSPPVYGDVALFNSSIQADFSDWQALGFDLNGKEIKNHLPPGGGIPFTWSQAGVQNTDVTNNVTDDYEGSTRLIFAPGAFEAPPAVLDPVRYGQISIRVNRKDP